MSHPQFLHGESIIYRMICGTVMLYSAFCVFLLRQTLTFLRGFLLYLFDDTEPFPEYFSELSRLPVFIDLLLIVVLLNIICSIMCFMSQNRLGTAIKIFSASHVFLVTVTLYILAVISAESIPDLIQEVQ